MSASSIHDYFELYAYETIIDVVTISNLLIASFVILITFILIYKDIFWIFKKIDKESPLNGGNLVAKALLANKVDYVFTLCGGHISPILAGAEKNSIKVIDVRNEATAVFAADAVARISGKVGVAAVTAGPGLTNTVTALKNAQMAESPVLLLSGAAPGLSQNRGALQDIDQVSIVKSLCKFVGRASSVRNIVPLVNHAIHVATSGTPGPVFIEFPIDTLYSYNVVEKQLGIPKNTKNFMSKIVTFYMRMYLKYIFAGGFENFDKEIILRKPNIPQPRADEIQKLYQFLVSAKKPVIVLGSQLILPPISAAQSADNVKSMNIPVYTTGMTRGILGRNHKMLYRHARKVALKEADLVILAGSVCDFRLDYGRCLSNKAKIVSINRSRTQVKLNSDMFWKPSLTIEADVGTTLHKLVEFAKNSDKPLGRPVETWIASLDERESHRDNEILEKASQETVSHKNPLHLLMQLEEHGLSDDDILVVDGGDFVGSASYILRPRNPLSWLDPGAFGTLGVGAGFAIGAKLCRPKSNVWIIYGDGSCGYSIAEMDTMQRHGLAAIAVIGTDAAWGQISRDQVRLLGTNVACGITARPYHIAASALASPVDLSSGECGSAPLVGGYLVTRSTSDEKFVGILREARQLASSGTPCTINCMIGSTDFREGSISC